MIFWIWDLSSSVPLVKPLKDMFMEKLTRYRGEMWISLSYWKYRHIYCGISCMFLGSLHNILGNKGKTLLISFSVREFGKKRRLVRDQCSLENGMIDVRLGQFVVMSGVRSPGQKLAPFQGLSASSRSSFSTPFTINTTLDRDFRFVECWKSSQRI